MILGVPLFLMLSGCASFKIWTGLVEFKKPKVEYESCSLESLGSSKANFRAKISIQNENKYAIDIEQFQYEFYLEDQKAGQGKIEKSESIKALSSTTVELPIELDYQTILLKGLALQMTRKEDAQNQPFLTLKGSGKFSGEFGTIERDFEKGISQSELRELLKKKIE